MLARSESGVQIKYDIINWPSWAWLSNVTLRFLSLARVGLTKIPPEDGGGEISDKKIMG